MRKQVDLARVYANTPEVMVMDEPFGALDQQTKSTMEGELLHLSEASRSTVLCVTHDLKEAVFLPDEIVVLAPNPGRVKAVMTVDMPRPRNEDMRLLNEFWTKSARCTRFLRNKETQRWKRWYLKRSTIWLCETFQRLTA